MPEKRKTKPAAVKKKPASKPRAPKSELELRIQKHRKDPQMLVFFIT